jgi:hypothetical protein
VLTDKNVGERRGKKYCMDCIFEVLRETAKEVKEEEIFLASFISPEKIINMVSIYYHVEVGRLVGTAKSAHLVAARQVAMFLVRNFTTLSFPEISMYFGNRNHTTVMAACKRTEKRMRESKLVAVEVTRLSRLLKIQQQMAASRVEAYIEGTCLACGGQMEVYQNYSRCTRCGYTDHTCQ